MSSVLLELDAIYKLAEDVMTVNGCDPANAAALADIMTRAERDGSHSHGLFPVPGYVKALRSGKVDGKAKPTVNKITPAVIQVTDMAVLPLSHRPPVCQFWQKLQRR